MNALGIISEYNPFHNGHLYQIQCARQDHPDSVIIALMSGDFTQRGELACLSKFDRTRTVLPHVDLVIELPHQFAIQSAQYFAQGAIEALRHLNVSTLSFGSESGSIDQLTKIAKKLHIINEEYKNDKHEVISYMRRGNTYAQSMNQLLDNQFNDTPNDILATQYIYHNMMLDQPMTLHTVQRKTSHHHNKKLTKDPFTSGTSIRNNWSTQIDQNPNNTVNLSQYVPPSTYQFIQKQKPNSNDLFLPYILFTLERINYEDLMRIHLMKEDFAHRLIKYKHQMRHIESFDALCLLLKSKNYTYTFIQRMLIHIMLNIQTIDEIKGLRVLGMNQKGRKYLKQLNSDIEIITNVNKQNKHLIRQNIESTNMYNFITKHKENDFNRPVILDKSEVID